MSGVEVEQGTPEVIRSRSTIETCRRREARRDFAKGISGMTSDDRHDERVDVILNALAICGRGRPTNFRTMRAEVNEIEIALLSLHALISSKDICAEAHHSSVPSRRVRRGSGELLSRFREEAIEREVPTSTEQVLREEEEHAQVSARHISHELVVHGSSGLVVTRRLHIVQVFFFTDQRLELTDVANTGADRILKETSEASVVRNRGSESVKNCKRQLGEVTELNGGSGVARQSL